MARVGVDVGGTNTDLVLEADHGVFVHKIASTPHDQSEGVLKGLRELCDISGVQPQDVSLIVHGTTVATNITIEHNGAEVGMLTTRNFRDILHIGRHKRPYNFSLHFEVPWQHALVKRRNRIAVTERILPPDGKSKSRSTRRKSPRLSRCSSAAASNRSSSAFCFVSQRCPRAARRRNRSRRNAGRLCLHLVGSRQRRPRIRALLDRAR